MYLGRISGAYKGVGFYMVYNTKSADSGKIICLERTAAGITYDGQQGSYCKSIMNGTYLKTDNGYQYVLN